jgi:hypothetical protein
LHQCRGAKRHDYSARGFLTTSSTAFIGSSPAFRVLSSSFFDRQVLLYQHVLESGAGRGVFRLACDSDSLSRGLVAMEDGLGLQVVVATRASTAPRRSRADR